MSGSAITYENLYLNPFGVAHITGLKIIKNMGEHAVMCLTGILSEDAEEKYIYELGMDTPVMLGYNMGDRSGTLFNGLVTAVQVSREGNVLHLKLEAKSHTCRMDRLKRSRSFQNKGMTSHELIRKVLSEYRDADAILHIPDTAIKRLIVQYEETDWEFLNRFVSGYGTGLIPEVTADSLKLYAGVSESGSPYELSSVRYAVEKSMEEYERVKCNDWPQVQELDYVTFLVENAGIYHVGNPVVFREKNLMVRSAEHSLASGILVNRYRLRQAEGLRQIKQYHEQLAGVSINGVVAGVSRNMVKVSLKIDGYGKASYWFPYSTMSASPDGSGWYCMPEKGDEVRVYFPTKDEGEAYAVSAVSGYQPGQSGSISPEQDMMGDPDVRYLRTVHDKLIQLTEDGILINADSGMAFIMLRKDGSIGICGEKNVTLTADQISITGSKVLLAAEESVEISSDQGGKITMDTDGTRITGAQILSN